MTKGLKQFFFGFISVLLVAVIIMVFLFSSMERPKVAVVQEKIYLAESVSVDELPQQP